MGDSQKDDARVLDEVNGYIQEKIGVRLNIIKAGWADYNQKMQVVINTDDTWDLCFTSSWTNDYLQNVQRVPNYFLSSAKRPGTRRSIV